MNCEIEFLPVGEKSKPGDAIVVRYGSPNDYKLMLIDGGHTDTGKKIVEHVREHFGRNKAISHVLLTHSDGDHACGLIEVLSELPVENFWLHMPWTFATSSRQFFANKNWTDQGLATALRQEYDVIDRLVSAAEGKHIHIEQPFAGSVIGPFTVLSPYREIYPLFLPQFDRTPDPDQRAIEEAGLWIGKPPDFIATLVDKVAEKIQKWIPEAWDNERLKDGGVTSATNETSVVLYGDFNAGKVLLTGDAGFWGLSQAAHFAELAKLAMQNFSFVQIPHHGSRRNVGPTILNRVLGPIRTHDAARGSMAFVSAPKDDATHPRKMVLNAFMRRGFEYAATQGNKTVYWGGFPPRPNYGIIPPCQFNSQVEDYD